ncbi:MAG: Clp protease N-terminal domain-containing protein [Dehalococcoidales bacterium]|nr:Clp protease N-terminal domain-containing protein [Dehalococcoidales bacterium]
MRQEKFTEQAQEALAASQELVRTYKHNQWDVEHILMALLQQEQGLVVELMKLLGVDINAVKQRTGAVLE